jgi:leucyl-tRNA synthetase
LATAELLQDAEFSPTIAKAMRERLERLYKFASEVAKTYHKRKTSEKSLAAIDRWMLSRLQEHIRKATEAMDKLAVRKAIHAVIYELDQDFQWYLKRTADKKEKRKDVIAYVSNEVLDAQIQMLAPVAPHICEELWEMMGREGFVSLSSWPKPDDSKTNIKAEENEALIVSVLEDTLSIIKATGVTPKRICYYTASPWRWKVYLKMLEKSMHGEVKMNELMKELAADEDLKKYLAEIAKFASKTVKTISELSEGRRQNLLKIGMIDEKATISDAMSFLSGRFKAKIMVYDEGEEERYDPKQRAAMSMPCRPAIYIE